MITIFKGNTGNTILTTFSERLDLYNIEPEQGQEFYFRLVNDTTKTETDFSLTDTSSAYWRFNAFVLDETQFNFQNGSYTYTGYADLGYTQPLETGKLIVSGTNTNNSIYW